MSKDALKKEIAAITNNADGLKELSETVHMLCDAFSRNEDALAGLHYSYRLIANDTGYTRAFAICDGHFLLLDDDAPTDVTVTGLAVDLQKVFSRRISPAMALLLGKVKFQGSKSALLHLGEFI